MPAKKVGKSSSKKTSTKEKKPVSKSKVKRTTAKKKTTTKPPVKKQTKLSSATTKKKPTTNKTVKKAETKPEVKQKEQSTALLVLSPFRFPLDIDLIVVRTARYGGVFFVLVGAFLTLFHSNLFFNNETIKTDNIYSASTIDSLLELKDETITHLSDLRFSYDFSREMPLSEVVEMNLKVENDLQSIHVTGYNSNNGYEVDFGKMEPVDKRNWKMKINTTDFDDGDYVLKFAVSSFNELYESVDKTEVSIDNSIIDEIDAVKTDGTNINDAETETATERSETTEADDVNKDEAEIRSLEEDTKDVTPNAEIAITGESPHDGKETISIYPKQADKVKLTAKNKKTGKRHTLGYAYDKTATHWKYVWDTTKYADGVYVIEATIIDGDKRYTSEDLDVTLLNQKESGIIEITEETKDIIETLSDSDLLDELNDSSKVTIRSGSPVSGNADIRIEVNQADFIEMYAIKKVSATYAYLGMAKKLEDGLWSYTWNTTNNPNGEYRIAAKIKNAYGTFESFSSYVKVENLFEKEETDDEIELKEALKETADFIEKQNEVLTNEELKSDIVEQNQETIGEDLSEDAAETDTDPLSTLNKEELDKTLNKLATAIRVGDKEAVTDSRREIEELKTKIKSESSNDGNTSTSNLEKDLEAAVTKVIEDVEKTNKIIRERVQVEAEKDSDKDGIADYDEINLYGTDPFVADTDGDGFIDGAEILSGYDPKDSKAETVVQFESPKETGVVREDILVVENITTSALTDEEKEKQVSPKAIIAGKALPNSFVTLYIFSTPVVVTVKTESDGSWQYRFDKELEDGQHEVYVGVTDNAGKIIAKSNPLTFVKTAEAFNEIETPVSGIVTEDAQGSDGFISLQVIYFILSVSVVSIGLVLILLGLHLDARPRKLQLKEETSVA